MALSVATRGYLHDYPMCTVPMTTRRYNCSTMPGALLAASEIIRDAFYGTCGFVDGYNDQ